MEHWRSYRAELKAHFSHSENIPHEYRRRGLPNNFFCNANAYGQYLKDRNEDQDGKFWELSQTIVWPDPSWPDFPVPFMTLWNWLDEVKRKYPHLCLSMGKLSRYLLVADMHAAGLVQAPSIEDSGSIINYLNTGAVKGLVMLGYLSGNLTVNGHTKQIVTAAFAQFFTEVEQSLTVTEQAEMPWNTIVAEHTLCKFTRMRKKRCYM